MHRDWHVRGLLLWACVLLILLGASALSITNREGWRAAGEMLALALAVAFGVLVYRDARREMAQRQVLLKVSEELSSRLELGDLLDYIVQAILRLVPLAQKCVIHLLDEAGRRLYPRYTSQPDYASGAGMPANRGIAGQALQELRTKVVNDVSQEPGFLPLKSRSDLRSLMVAPLHSQGKPLGTISLNSSVSGAFSERDETLVTTLAAQASAAINQTRLYALVLRGTQQIEAIVNNLADGLVVLDAEDRIVRYNPPLAHLLGVEVSEIVGQKVEPTSDHEGIRRLARILGTPPSDAHQSYAHQVELGEPVHAILQVQVSPVQDQEGGWGRIVILHDQTEELDLIRAKSGFMAAASRELRPPLESIRGYAALLMSYNLPEQPTVRDWASRIHAQSVRLIQLATDLADLCAADSGQIEINKEPVELDALVSEVLDELSQATQHKQLTIQRQFPPNLPAVPLDQDRMRHVLVNLLDNAIHRAHPGEHITMRLEANLDELVFSLRDDGEPLSPDAQAMLLRTPHAAHPSAFDASTDTGLGLYISRRIVEAHGGHLWIEQGGQHETTLQFILPLAMPESVPVPRN